ncbi:MAG: hypothetical protein ABI591_04615 [Kofleriaceae bacterium]
MRGSMSWFAAAVVGIGCTHGAGTSGNDAVVKPPPSILDVPTLSGGTEPVWIYVATPVGPGPYPVVIYGHGQGTDNVVNCTPDRPPDDGDAITGEHIADALAARGYLTISIFYRNRGAMVPAIGELRGRDHYILDARAFLAAAHLAHDQLGGDSRVALIGVSMGSFPATWAVAPLPELADLQAGLDIVTSIPTAMLGNQIGNTGRSKAALTTGEALCAQVVGVLKWCEACGEKTVHVDGVCRDHKVVRRRKPSVVTAELISNPVGTARSVVEARRTGLAAEAAAERARRAQRTTRKAKGSRGGKVRYWLSLIFVAGIVIAAGFFHVVYGGGISVHICAKHGWSLADTLVDLDDYRPSTARDHTKVGAALVACGL